MGIKNAKIIIDIPDSILSFLSLTVPRPSEKVLGDKDDHENYSCS